MKKKKDIQDELREQSSFLSEKMKTRSGGFKVPNGYFDQLSDRVLDKVENDRDSKAELAELSPLLSEKLEQRKGGMKLPPNYFDNIADRVEEAVQPPSAKVRRIGSSWNIKRMSAAAAILFLVVASIWLFLPKGESDLLAQLEGYNEAEVLEYLDENAADFEFGDLLESGLISHSDIDFQEPTQLSEEEEDLYINTILEEDM